MGASPICLGAERDCERVDVRSLKRPTLNVQLSTFNETLGLRLWFRGRLQGAPPWLPPPLPRFPPVKTLVSLLLGRWVRASPFALGGGKQTPVPWAQKRHYTLLVAVAANFRTDHGADLGQEIVEIVRLLNRIEHAGF